MQLAITMVSLLKLTRRNTNNDEPIKATADTGLVLKVYKI